MNLDVQCQRTRLYLGDVEHRLNGVWTCRYCPDRETYELVRDPDLLALVERALRSSSTTSAANTIGTRHGSGQATAPNVVLSWSEGLAYLRHPIGELRFPSTGTASLAEALRRRLHAAWLDGESSDPWSCLATMIALSASARLRRVCTNTSASKSHPSLRRRLPGHTGRADPIVGLATSVTMGGHTPWDANSSARLAGEAVRTLIEATDPAGLQRWLASLTPDQRAEAQMVLAVESSPT